MRDIEGEIADVVLSGQRVFFAATPVYAGNELIPRSILLTAQKDTVCSSRLLMRWSNDRAIGIDHRTAR
jgi:hypothetical protein